MIDRGQDLTLGAEAFRERIAVEAAADELDGDFLRVLAIGADGAIDLAHATVADLFHDLVDADAAPDAVGTGAHVQDRASQIGHGILEERAAGPVVRAEEGVDLAAQLRVTRADVVQVRGALVHGQGNGPVQNLANLRPAFRLHGDGRQAAPGRWTRSRTPWRTPATRRRGEPSRGRRTASSSP
jgi:hypothetical protein